MAHLSFFGPARFRRRHEGRRSSYLKFEVGPIERWVQRDRSQRLKIDVVIHIERRTEKRVDVFVLMSELRAS